ncbi:hypothetical protein ACVILK_000614 [Bradyrhizobium embrapense]
MAYSQSMARPSEKLILATVRRVATALLPELPSIGDGTLSHILAAMPEVPRGAMIDLARASCHANSKAVLHALIDAVPFEQMTPPAEVVQSTRAMVRHNFGYDAIMRAYRVGLMYWCKRWSDAVERHCRDTTIAVAVVSFGTTFLIGWLDLITHRLGAEYRDEAERVAREGSLAWAAYVQRLLIEDDVSMRDASLRLGYNLAGHHVALVLQRHQTGDQTPLDSVAQEIAATLSRAKPLLVRTDIDTVWCWVSANVSRAPPPTQAAVLVGQGRPAVGLVGFRRSHREARDALRVARSASYPAGSVAHFEHVELAALCGNDPAYCRAFIADKLGPLADETVEARRLRATLKGFFDANSNLRAAGACLGLHHNTIRYRLDRVETLLGRQLEKDRLHLELALHLVDRLTAPQAPAP